MFSRMRSTIITILLISAILLLPFFESSCLPNRLPLESNINFRIIEMLPKSYDVSIGRNRDWEGPHLILTLSTEANYPSGGYILDVSSYRLGRNITANIHGILKPRGPAIQMILPAGCNRYDLGEITGNFDLVIQYGMKRDRYKLSITDDEIKIAPISATFTQTKNQLLLRIPDNLIWVDCTKLWIKEYETYESLCPRVHNDLISLGSTPFSPKEGTYTFRDDFTTAYKDNFYKYFGDINQLESLANSYNDCRYMSIDIWTWQGHYFSNRVGW